MSLRNVVNPVKNYSVVMSHHALINICFRTPLHDNSARKCTDSEAPSFNCQITTAMLTIKITWLG